MRSDDAERGRQKLASMGPSERAKFDATFSDIKVRLAELYGEIDELVVSNIQARAAINLDVQARVAGATPLCAIEDTAQQLADSEPWLGAYIDSKNEKLKRQLEANALSELPAHMRMSMERSGKLVSHLQKKVDEGLADRQAQRLN
ncbi:hypothetical protein E2K80_04770 [Rhodophyticola sp. CCM32]|uniref:hypothetical protein n=1 Tax=Rhodophyticola sp. CCM32 TaxID=2916397 RepID=UPI00107F17B3|nr:hypothetical protein [Rhodophyticola sp. CCM32]QBY00135.1 hypothetical protein E2K80_04770 [Rhodophyticola sp. CCM32]